MSGGSGFGGIAGLVIGAALAPMTGGFSMMAGASFGFAAGSLLGGLLMPPSLPGQTAEGPRLQDLKVQSATYGRPIPIILGKMRTAGNIIWIKTGGLIEERVEQTTRSGGGKTGGGASTTQVFYNYYATCAIAVCKGPIKAIVKIWADSKLVYNAEAIDPGTVSANAQFQEYVHGYLGDETQVADSVLSADMGMGNVPGYRGLAYVVLERFPLKDYGNRIPNFTFEVASLVSTKTLANPAGQGAGESAQYSEVTVITPLPSMYKLVLNFNGTNGASSPTDFVDSSSYGKKIGSVSGASLSTAAPVFGSAYGLFPSGAYIRTSAGDTDFNLSVTEPWQISFRFAINDKTNNCYVLKTSEGAGYWRISVGAGGIRFESDSGNDCAATFNPDDLVNNTWSALRVSHDGAGNLRFYKDGAILYSGPNYTGSTVFPISSFAGGTRLDIGNMLLTVGTPTIGIDELLIQKGGTVTVANSYTVETYETATTTATRLQMAGGRTDYIDYSGNNRLVVSTNGSPTASTSVKKFGTASRLFDPGDAINYHNASWQSLSNSGTWGIGFCIRFKDTVGSCVIMGTGGVSSAGWQISYDNGTNLLKFTHSSGTVLSWSFTPVADTWYTIGFSKITLTSNARINPGGFPEWTVSGPGEYLRCFVDGILLGQGSYSEYALSAITNNAGSVFSIGQPAGGAVSYYLDEIIIQDTSNIYTGWDIWGYNDGGTWRSYAIPTSEFSPDANTRLLLHFNQSNTGRWVGGGAAVDSRVSNIISYLCENAGLLDYNTDYIADNDDVAVPGFVMNSVAPVRSSLEMLAAAFFLDIVESTTTLYFVSRNSLINGGPAAIISESDLSARHITSSVPEPLDITTQQEVEIPKELAVRYLDASRDYYEASQRSVKQNTGSIGRVELNLAALSLTDSQAKLAAIGNHMFAWAERKKYKFTLPLKYAWLDCADMVQINFSSQSHFVRITKMNYGAGYFDVEGVGQDFTGIPFQASSDGYSGPVSSGVFADQPEDVTALIISSTDTRGNPGTPAPQTIDYPVVSTLILLDMAIISDSEDGMGYYVCIDKGAAANYWPGAVVFKSSDDASFATLLGLASALTTGQAMTKLASGQTELWDMANTVTIALTNGTVASDTEANVLNGANIGILGDEIVQWTTATVDGNGYYVLSGLLRGRRGTEWAVGLHSAGERFILFNTASVQRAPGVSEEIGLQRVYRGVTSGLNLADQASQNFTNTANGLKPYSPCQITGSRDGSNNLTINWVRRTRTGGSWKDNVDVSLGEASEQYAVDITNEVTRVAAMTSNVLPAGYVASASTELNAPRAAWKAFDAGADANDHGWYTNAIGTGWLAIELPVALVITRYSIKALNRTDEALYNVKTWTFEGWDGSAWVVLDTQTNVSAWTASETRMYTFANSTAYIKYRVNVSVSQGGSYVAIQQLKLFLAPVVRTITGLTSQTATYTAAEQTADGLTPGDSVSVNIYQISSTVGRGYAGAKTI